VAARVLDFGGGQTNVNTDTFFGRAAGPHRRRSKMVNTESADRRTEMARSRFAFTHIPPIWVKVNRHLAISVRLSALSVFTILLLRRRPEGMGQQLSPMYTPVDQQESLFFGHTRRTRLPCRSNAYGVLRRIGLRLPIHSHDQ